MEIQTTDKVLSTNIEIPHFFTTKKLDIAHNYYRPIEEQKEDIENLLKITKTDHLFFLNQTHSATVIYVDENSSGTEKIDADSLVTNKPNVALGILTADCVPVLFYDKEHKVIGAAHAGWKGAKQNICHNVILEMQKLGAKLENIGVIIGPYIHQKSYEVDSNYKNSFISDDANNEQFFTPSIKDGHFMFDLGGYVKYRLKNSGIQNITDINMDTYSNEELFFSYRRDCHAGLSYQRRNILSVIHL